MDVTADNKPLDQNEIMPSDLEQIRQQHYDAVGIDQLESLLRHHITEYLKTYSVLDGRNRRGSYKLLSDATGISYTYLWQFHKQERAICITNMNTLANHFGVRYLVSNFLRKS